MAAYFPEKKKKNSNNSKKSKDEDKVHSVEMKVKFRPYNSRINLRK